MAGADPQALKDTLLAAIGAADKARYGLKNARHKLENLKPRRIDRPRQTQARRSGIGETERLVIVRLADDDAELLAQGPRRIQAMAHQRAADAHALQRRLHRQRSE